MCTSELLSTAPQARLDAAGRRLAGCLEAAVRDAQPTATAQAPWQLQYFRDKGFGNPSL